MSTHDVIYQVGLVTITLLAGLGLATIGYLCARELTR